MIVALINKWRDALALRRLRQQCRLDLGKGVRMSPRKIRVAGDNEFVIGHNTILGGGVAFERVGARVEIGHYTQIGGACILTAAKEIYIGNNVLIAWGVTIADHNSHCFSVARRIQDTHDWYVGKKNWDGVRIEPVRICDEAWIGFGVAILRGVTVGRGAIVGAGSIVTRNVPDYTIVAGNPARVIRELTREEREEGMSSDI